MITDYLIFQKEIVSLLGSAAESRGYLVRILRTGVKINQIFTSLENSENIIN